MASRRRCDNLEFHAKRRIKKNAKTILNSILQSWLEPRWQNVSIKSRYERAVDGGKGDNGRKGRHSPSGEAQHSFVLAYCGKVSCCIFVPPFHMVLKNMNLKWNGLRTV